MQAGGRCPERMVFRAHPSLVRAAFDGGEDLGERHGAGTRLVPTRAIGELNVRDQGTCGFEGYLRVEPQARGVVDVEL